MSFIYALEATWNDVSKIFDGIEINVSDGHSGPAVYASGSKVLQLKNNGTSIFSVDPLGNVYSAAGFLNQLVPINISSTLSNNTNGQKVVLGGNNFSTITLAAVSNYTAGFSVMLINVDALTAKIIAPNGGINFRLWPGQYTIAYIYNGIWSFTPITPWKWPSNLTIYANPTGSNDNDGLDITRPLKDLTFNGGMLTIAWREWDLNFFNMTAQLADGTYTGGLHIAGKLPGQQNDAGLLVQGNASSPGNVIIDVPGAEAIGAFNNGWVQVKNMKLQSTTGNGGILAKSGSKIETLGGIIFGPSGAGEPQQRATQGGLILHNGNFQILGANLAYGYSIENCSKLVFGGGVNVDYMGDVSYVQSNCFCSDGSATKFSGAVFNLNGHTITGVRYQADAVSVINTNFSGANYIPGNMAGSAANGGVYM